MNTQNVSIHTRENAGTGFMVPVGAVFYDTAGRACVWKVEPGKMVTQKTTVTTAELSGEKINVLHGLEPGDNIITAGASFLKEGQKVKFLN